MRSKIYFVSDLHLGVPDKMSSLEREKKFVRFLTQAAKDATEIYLLGDIFDMWFEYKRVVPRGYVRLLGKLAELRDQGIPIFMFTGNHDMWMFNYFPEELNIPVFREPVLKRFGNKQFLIGHGDGLGPGDHGYKFIKRVFASPVNKWLFARLHPNFGLGIANYFSRRSRISNGDYDTKFLGEEKEMLIQYAKNKLKEQHIDYFIFGHRHLPMEIEVGPGSTYINLGEWVSQFQYAVFDGDSTQLLQFSDDDRSSL